jgi:hypothetical protein
MEVSGQLHAPASLPPGKSSRYPLDKRVGGPQSRSGRRGENSWPYRHSNSEPSVVEPVASRHTDWATSSDSTGITSAVEEITTQFHKTLLRQLGYREC